MRILVDMDGIIADLTGKWLDEYNADYGDCLTVGMVDSWHIWECVKPQCSRADMMAYIRKPRFFDDLPPLPGAIEAVKELRRRGHSIKFATAPTGADSARAKMTWLDYHFAGSDLTANDAFICHDKTWINADLIIDDKPETLRRWQKTSPGFTATIEYPYNAHLAVDCMARDFSDTERAWGEILEFVEKLSQTSLFRRP